MNEVNSLKSLEKEKEEVKIQILSEIEKRNSLIAKLTVKFNTIAKGFEWILNFKTKMLIF